MASRADQVEAVSVGRFARLTGLNVLATLTVPLASLIDTAMLGHLPVETALAGVALGGLVFDYLFWGFGFLRMATTGLAAGAVGREDDEEVVALLWRAATIGLLIGLALLLSSPGIVAAARWGLPGEPSVVEAATAYVGARLWGAPATLMNFALTGWLLGTGRSGRALLLASVANLGNATLNVVFIWGLGWGAAGAGYATACGQWMAAAAVLPTLFGLAGARPSMRELFARARVAELFSLGTDITIRTVCLVTAMSMFTAAGAHWGSVALAGQAVLVRVLGLFSYVIDGGAQAVETMAGQAFAANRRTDVRRVIAWGFVVSVGFSSLLATGLLLAPEATLGLLTDIPAVRAHAELWVGWMCLVAFIGGFAYVLDGLFVGIAAGRALRNAMLVSFFLGFVPGFALSLWRGELWIMWATMAGFMLFRTATLAIAWRRGYVGDRSGDGAQASRSRSGRAAAGSAPDK